MARTAADGLEARDFKSMNSSAMNLFQCGHVQQIQVTFSQQRLFLSANCLPEMRKDRVYKVIISLSKTTWDILSAACGCPGGCGPVASCKHIAALCYAFCNFCEHGLLPDFLTCTDKLSEWNKPRSKKVDPIPVSDLQAHQLVKKSELITIKRMPRVPSNYDPRPINLRETSSTTVDNLRADLLLLPQPCAFLTILVPQVERALHDHTYSKPAADATDDLVQQSTSLMKESCPFGPEELQMKSEEMVKQLNMSTNSRNKVEVDTREQSNCVLWYQMRYPRITGSKCGRILTQKSKTKALLIDVLYSKPLDPIPLPIKWGRDKEPLAQYKYVDFLRSRGHHNLTVHKCGFYVHPHKGWLGASPDGVVYDPTVSDSQGILEIKCPYSARDCTVEEACKDTSFYCFLNGTNLRLKEDHHYYHQVQLQLYVCGSEYSWCDFCVYTNKDIAVERIRPDLQWQQQKLPQLQDYFYNYIL